MHVFGRMLSGSVLTAAGLMSTLEPGGIAFAADPVASSSAVASDEALRVIPDLNSGDPAIAARAEAKLTEMHVSANEIAQAKKLHHPKPEVRRQLAGQLAKTPTPLQEQFLLKLSRDVDSRVRTASIEAMKGSPPTPAKIARVQEMTHDSDSVVKGFAKLLATDWSLTPGKSAKTVASLPSAAGVARPQAARADLRQSLAADSATPAMARREPVQRANLRTANPNSRRSLLQTGYSEEPAAAPQEPMPVLAAEDAPVVEAEPAAPALAEPGDAAPMEPGVELESPLEMKRRPSVLDRPMESESEADAEADPIYDEMQPFLATPMDAPLGFTGPSSVNPTESQESSHFVPIEDRWRIGFPAYDRLKRGHPYGEDYAWTEGSLWDPYNQNVLKGDYPIIGQHTFLNMTAQSFSLVEFRQLPTATTPFESTNTPFQEEFFGNPDSRLVQQFFNLNFDVFHGNTTAFKPVDWQIRLNPIFNVNSLKAQELGVVNPDTRKGLRRNRDFTALEQWFVEAKVADMSPDYDFFSIRAGSQPFTSDFRGFIFSDINRGIRAFGTLNANRDQWNVAYFDQQEKDTNSGLNTFKDRHQNVFVANYYRQDFIFPGYTAQASYHYNHDKPSFKFDHNDFLVRPDPVGVFQPHSVTAHYLGFAGDGHIGRFNISHAYYHVTGTDSLNPLAGQEVDIRADMAAAELSYDRDWMRFRTSYFWASGDNDANDNKAKGFDSILDNVNFAGSEFSYYGRQGIPLFGVAVTQRNSLVADLRSSKTQGQSNFVNPGVHVFNMIGADFDVTPKLRFITNANYMWFDKTQTLDTFLFQYGTDQRIGTDLSLGMEYRPFLNNNVIIGAGAAGLFPAAGFRDLYNRLGGRAGNLYSNFFQVVLQY